MNDIRKVYIIHPYDNVATALDEVIDVAAVLGPGTTGESIQVNEPIPRGFKIALKDIHVGEDIIKYNVAIARATAEIKAGDKVHLHNVESKYDVRSLGYDPDTALPDNTGTMYSLQ